MLIELVDEQSKEIEKESKVVELMYTVTMILKKKSSLHSNFKKFKTVSGLWSPNSVRVA